MSSAGLPDTLAGTQAAWILSRFGRVLRGKEIREHFAPAFLDVVSPLRVRAVTLSLKANLPVTLSTMTGDDLSLRISLEGAQGPFTLSIRVEPDEPHLIAGLLVQPAEPSVGDVLRGAPARGDVRALVDEHVGKYAKALRGARAGAACAVRFRETTTVVPYGAVAEDSVFEIGSITKPVTATLLAEMVAAGEVVLDDPVERYIPSGASMPLPAECGPITLLELATHTSGLPRLAANMDVVDEEDPYKTFTLDVLFSGLAATPIDGRGTVQYSNLGYTLLGQAVARAAGSSYTDLVTRRVLEPLGMASARVGPDPALEERRVPGHAGGKIVPHWTRTAVTPAGGVEADARDVCAFGVAHATAESGSARATTHVRRFSWGERHIGLAWVIEETDHGDVLWHNGGTGGFQSFLGFHPSSGTAIAVLTNASDGAGPDAAAAGVLGALVKAV